MAYSAAKYSRLLLLFTVFLALGLRSLIPVGYMPDFSGHGKGLFPIIICDGFEHITQDAHTPDCPMHSHGSHGHSGLCPFGGSALVGFNPVIAPVLLGSAYTAALS